MFYKYLWRSSFLEKLHDIVWNVVENWAVSLVLLKKSVHILRDQYSNLSNNFWYYWACGEF